MLFLIWFVLCLAAASLILLPLALWLGEIYRRYSGSRLLTCPQDHAQAAVNIDARHAAETGIDGCPELRLCGCTRWPEHSNCARACLLQAIQTAPYTPPEVKARTKQIYHLPIFLAAFAAWCLGAFWHAQYLFRPQWMNAVGLTHAQVKQIVWWLSPHLLTAAVCLLFAYGVALLLVVSHRKGVLQGIMMSMLLCAGVTVASWFSLAGTPRELLVMEAVYVGLAALMVGTIIGGLQSKLVLPLRH